MGRLAELFESLRSPQGKRIRGRSPRTHRWRRITRKTQKKPRPNPQVRRLCRNEFYDFTEADFAQFMTAFDPANLGSKFNKVSPETVHSLTTLMHQLMETSTAHALMSAVNAAMPAVQEFLSILLEQTGPALIAAVDPHISTLRISITPQVGAENAQRVTDFVREALADEGVLALLRTVSGIRVSFDRGTDWTAPVRPANYSTISAS